jgi:hypothetical protein
MLRYIVALFLTLHGFVHLLYAGQSQRVFELQPGMVWPDGSWAFSWIAGVEGARRLATILLVLATVGFVAGGAGILARQAWWRPVAAGVAVFSAVVFVLLWDGSRQGLANKGGVGVLINAAIVVAVLVLEWPDLGL